MRRERSQQIARPAKGLGAPPPAGVLHVVGVPIGHHDDLTVRALRILRQADIIVSEDPSATRSLLLHHGLGEMGGKLTGYGPANLKEKVAVLVHRLRAGAQLALVSDCGSPVIADPGCLLVAAAHAQGIRVSSVPGPSAIIAALSVSGFAADRFSFHGAVPPSPSAMRRFLGRLLKQEDPVVALCEPRSVPRLLDLVTDLAPRRRIMLACDLTAAAELVVRGTARQVRKRLATHSPNAVTLVIAGRGRLKGTPSD